MAIINANLTYNPGIAFEEMVVVVVVVIVVAVIVVALTKLSEWRSKRNNF